MSKYFNQYADLTALCLTFLLPVLFVWLVKRRVGKKVRAVPAWLLFFGPSGIMVFIFFHLLENSYHAVEGLIADTFVYNFKFYSLILLGLVVGLSGYLFWQSCLKKCLFDQPANRSVFKAILLVVLICAPLIPIIAISWLPIICCGVSLIGLPFTRRRLNNAAIIPMTGKKAVVNIY